MIYRISNRKGKPFTIIDKSILDSKNLSWKAKGVLSYLLGKPDSWILRIEDIINHSFDGETAVRSAVNELIKAGYIVRSQQRDNKGRMSKMKYAVYEEPLNCINESECPHVENSNADNRYHNNNDISNNKKNNTHMTEKREILGQPVSCLCNLGQNNVHLKKDFPLTENYQQLTKELERLTKQDKRLTTSYKKKEEKDSNIKIVIDYWHNKVLQEKGFKPVIDGADAVAAKRALSALGSVDRVKQAIDWFLENKKSKELGIVLSVALSKHSLNLFLAEDSDNRVVIKNAITPQKQ